MQFHLIRSYRPLSQSPLKSKPRLVLEKRLEFPPCHPLRQLMVENIEKIHCIGKKQVFLMRNSYFLDMNHFKLSTCVEFTPQLDRSTEVSKTFMVKIIDVVDSSVLETNRLLCLSRDELEGNFLHCHGTEDQHVRMQSFERIWNSTDVTVLEPPFVAVTQEPNGGPISSEQPDLRTLLRDLLVILSSPEPRLKILYVLERNWFVDFDIEARFLKRACLRVEPHNQVGLLFSELSKT